MRDFTIKIAVGTSRFAKSWKNKEISYRDFVEKLRNTTRTPETVAEYAALPKAEQDRVKDVGGFVGGYLADGRRAAGHAKERYLVTLDADFADSGFISTVDMLFSDCAYVIYSTHKHTPAKPRLRLILPLSRPVPPDAYQAISRKIAADIGIDLFDDTTYQPERLMYWPSTSTDGQYVFEFNDSGEALDPYVILNTYPDWTDVSSWPESGRVAKQRAHTAEKQGDPLEKDGLIGAFCRAYGIREAIDTFLPEIYTPCGKDDRFTYAAGSTAAGLVTYENKFAYSHHGTDPISGQLCNAFDLVRIHKFGKLDEKAAPETETARLPSFKAMQEFAAKDDRVKEEQFKDIAAGFDEGADIEWMKKLELDKKGNIVSSPANVKQILRCDPFLSGRIGYNEFSYRICVLANLPWERSSDTGDWTDGDDSCLRNYLSETYGVTGANVIYDACAQVFMEHRYHPVRDYISSLDWDGVPRVDTFWIDYLGAEDTKYTRTVTRKHLVAAVARVFKPGVKFDYVVVLSGPQGIGKSTLLNALSRGWFCDSLQRVDTKDAYEQLRGAWLIELSELSATKKAESEAVKQFLSKREDRYRPAYGRRAQSFPRQCVFYGSTNEQFFLRDRTGNRRFWPLPVTGSGAKDFMKITDEEIGQIWAEAYTLYQHDERLYLDKEMEIEAIRMQQEAYEENPLTGVIQEYLDTLLPEGWKDMDIHERREFLDTGVFDQKVGTVKRDRVCVMEIWCEALRKQPEMIKPIDGRELNAIMRSMEGWAPVSTVRFGKNYGRQRGFIRCEKT